MFENKWKCKQRAGIKFKTIKGSQEEEGTTTKPKRKGENKEDGAQRYKEDQMREGTEAINKRVMGRGDNTIEDE